MVINRRPKEHTHPGAQCKKGSTNEIVMQYTVQKHKVNAEKLFNITATDFCLKRNSNPIAFTVNTGRSEGRERHKTLVNKK